MRGLFGKLFKKKEELTSNLKNQKELESKKKQFELIAGIIEESASKKLQIWWELC